MTNNSSTHPRGCRCENCQPVTMRDVTTAFAEIRAEFNRQKATDSKPRRTRDQIIRGMISAIDNGLASRRRPAADTDPDYVSMPATRPVSPLRAADGTPFHRAPVGIVPRPAILVSFDAALKAAGDKMRAAFRPTA